MRNIKNEFNNVIKGILVSLISNILLDLYKHEFSISKINFDSLISTFVEFWWLVLIIFILALLRFKMKEKPHKINYHHRHADFVGRCPISHDGGLWEVVVEEINPLITYNTGESNIHYYIDKLRCTNKLNNGEPCLSELYLIDIGFCYLEKCDNCSFKRLTLKSHEKEISEILTKIDALIIRKSIKDCDELLDVLCNEKKL
ncbi:hypothetical protein [uncultured Methanobrevibacter sp.]|uniref:hypothetical protein n=1 Tax=uncultured Methanobrevibacter sp. TaxID=253161 RepID=UPI0025E1406B|nr:hypothetical protein [uncultured Methanobrevibacter sp.]